MLYFNRNGVGFRIPIKKDGIYSRELLEKQIHTSLISLQNLKDRSLDLEQMRFEKKGEYIVTSVFGRDEILIYPPELPIKKPWRKENERERTQERIIIGIEYTDGTKGTTYNIWENYIGSGVVIGTIANGLFNNESVLEWRESVPLLGSPIAQDDYYFFGSLCQGGDKVNNIGAKKILTQLDEVNYDTDYKFHYVEEHNYNDTYWDLFEIFSDELHHIIFGYHEEVTTYLELNGEIIAGPYVISEGRIVEVWQDPRVGIGWTIGEETIYYSGQQIVNSSIAGSCVDTNTFILFYDLFSATEEIDPENMPGSPGAPFNSYSWKDKPTSGAYQFRRDDSLDFSYEFDTDWEYYGNFGSEGHINYSGNNDLIGYRGFASSASLYFDGYIGRCARIFKNTDGTLIYLYSFSEPVLLDEEETDDAYLEAPTCGYGAVISGVNNIAPGFEMIIEDDGYQYDLNIVPGLPTDMYSSILLRAYKEITTFKTTDIETGEE